MLLPAKKSRTDPFGRYYTNAFVSDFLVAELGKKRPEKIIDLGSGAGSLTRAARTKWRDAEIVTVDIDPSKNLVSSGESLNGGAHRHFSYDALRLDLPEILGSKSSIDLAICNPPFIKPVWRPEFSSILEEAGLSSCYPVVTDATAEVLFLAQNLRLVRDKGMIGMIVPDCIVSGKKHAVLRQTLIENHFLQSVIKLPRRAFAGTDAQAFIVILQKNRNAGKRVSLASLANTELLPFSVNKNAATQSLDYDYNARKLDDHSGTINLNDLIISIRRGRISSSERLTSGRQYFHTTDFPISSGKQTIDFGNGFYVDQKHDSDIIAGPGDILISRVGRNLQEKICLVTSGRAAVTDCVYIIKPVEIYRELIFSQLCSQAGRTWLADIAHGVGASQLPKSDLLKFPVKIK